MSTGVGVSPGQTEVNPLIKFTSNAELDRMEEEKRQARKAEEPQVIIDDLAKHVRVFFGVAKQAKQEVENKLIEILRQIKGEYEADKLAAISSFGGSTDFIRITSQKVRDVESWITDIINPYGDRTWEIEPTPISDIPDEVLNIMRTRLRTRLMQQAVQQTEVQGTEFSAEQLQQTMEIVEKKVVRMMKKKVQALARQKSTNMRIKILDQYEEGGWNTAFRACITDLSRLKSCVMKGPVFKKIPRLRWEHEGGRSIPVITFEAIPTFSRVSPFDWYPAPKSSNVHQGDAIEVEHLAPIDIQRMVGVPGYKDDVINKIIRELPNGFKENVSIESQRQDLEKDNTISDPMAENTYDMINFWGIVPGSLLIKAGVTKFREVDVVSSKYYSVNVKTINDQIIKEPTINPDPLGHKPYSVTSFIKNNDSQWGDCPAELMTDIQSIANASVRALVNNIAITSGPLTEMDQDRLAPGETGEIWPWKRIMTTNKKMQEGKAVNFYQAKLLAAELLGVYEKFKKEADEIVVPSFGRTDVGGAGRTSSGLSMIMGAAARNIKLAVLNIDEDIVMPMLHRIFNFNMLFLDDDSIKGDIRIRARGTGGVIAKEQLAVRRNEFRATLKPTDEQLIGTPGLAYILRKNIESLDMDVDRAMPGFDDLEELDPLTPPPVPIEGGEATGTTRPRIVDAAGNPVGGTNEASLFRQRGVDTGEET
jgi:hypothetical protein